MNIIAKNTWNEGLILDFAPDNTQANTLTSALNATLTTMNGNELSLQNDMGNGRVETARLPEGYIPVGTCEYGDIIYIVSYNPLENKSQIGCFPSPERNITSEEQGLPNVSISNAEFVSNGKIKATSVKKIIYGNKMNPGDKFVIYSSAIENNADKLSDYGSKTKTYGSIPKLTRIHIISIEDSGKINFLDTTVKWYDDYYIAPANNGDNSFDIDSYRNLVSSGYSVFRSKISGKLALLIELERINTFNCSYSLYSKDSGTNNKSYTIYFNSSWETDNADVNPSKLVLTKSSFPYLTEYGVPYSHFDSIDDNGKITYTTSHASFSDITGWDDYGYFGATFSRIHLLENPENYESNNITLGIKKLLDSLEDYPTKIVLKYNTEGTPIIENDLGKYVINPAFIEEGDYKKYKEDGSTQNCEERNISDDIINNFFHIPVTKPVVDISIPYKVRVDNTDYYNDISKMVWNYEIAPAMPYGVLEDLAISGSIDFSKVGTGYTDLTEWRYYVDGNILTLRWGLETYPEINKKITKVAFELYDNNGLCATYEVREKPSYSGSFTETLLLGADGTNVNLTSRNITNGKDIIHKGDGPYTTSNPSDKDIESLAADNILIKESNGDIYYNDAGIIYPNLLYLAKIYIYTGSVDSLGNPINQLDEPKIFYRWLWTNTLMNEYFYTNKDFDNISPNLDITLETGFYSNEYFQVTNPISTEGGIFNKSGISENVTNENVVEKTLSWSKQEVRTNKEGDANLYLEIVPKIADHHNTFKLLGTEKDEIGGIKDLQYNIYFDDNYIPTPDYDVLFSNLFGDFSIKDIIGPQIPKSPIIDNPNTSPQGNNRYDWFTITPKLGISSIRKITYLTALLETIEKELPYITIDALSASTYKDNKGIPLVFKGEMYSRIAGTLIDLTSIDTIRYVPAIGSYNDLSKYNLQGLEDSEYVYFSTSLNIALRGNKDIELYYGESTTTNDGELMLAPNSACYVGPKDHKDVNIGNMYKQANIDQGPFSLLTFWSRIGSDGEDVSGIGWDSHSRDGAIDLRDKALNRGTINRDWLSNWRGHYDGDYILRRAWEGENHGDGGTAINFGDFGPWSTLGALVIKDIEGKYVLLNNFCTFESSKKLPIYQNFYKSSKFSSNTFAKLILSILSKLYYRSSETEAIEVPAISNYAICSNYVEDWNKNIIIEINEDDSKNKLEYLNMSGFKYIDYLESMGKYSTEASPFNINIKVNVSLIHTVLFKYSLEYMIDYLKQLFGKTSSKYYVYPDITGTFGGELVSEAPFVGTIGTIKDNKLVNLFLSDYIFNSLTGNLNNLTNSETKFKVSPQLLLYLTVKDDLIMLKSITYSTTDKILFIGGDTEATMKGDSWIVLDKNKYLIDESIFKISK